MGVKPGSLVVPTSKPSGGDGARQARKVPTLADLAISQVISDDEDEEEEEKEGNNEGLGG